MIIDYSLQNEYQYYGKLPHLLITDKYSQRVYFMPINRIVNTEECQYYYHLPPITYNHEFVYVQNDLGKQQSIFNIYVVISFELYYDHVYCTSAM